MAALAAPPWPSQRRAASNSDRHAAMDRMRNRRAGRGGDFDDEPPARQPLSARPPRGNDPAARPRSGAGLNSSMDSSGSADAQPWAPAWNPQASPRKNLSSSGGLGGGGGSGAYDDLDEPPPAPRCPAPPSGPPIGRPNSRGTISAAAPAPAPPAQASTARGAAAANRLSSGFDDDRSGSMTSRAKGGVRGVAEARAAREEDELPHGAVNADFKTLQQMIARGIQEGDKGDLPEAVLRNDDADLQRHQEGVRRRREQEEQAREREREHARQKRRREEEERLRRQAEELDREFDGDAQQRNIVEQVKATCKREMSAASRIQSRFRGRRSRAGEHLPAPFMKRALHTQPWSQTAPNCSLRPSCASADDNELS